MSDTVSLPRYSGFEGVTHLASGDLATVALAIRQAARAADARTVLLFDNATGRAIDVDLRGSDDEILARLAAAAGTGAAAPDPDAGGEA
ncbi:DUF2239 family protein, partial [Burkholderia glumae]